MSFNKLIVTLFFAGLITGQQMYVTAASSAPQSASASSTSVSTDANASSAQQTGQKAEVKPWVEDLYEDNYVAPTPNSLAHAGGTEPKAERATPPILKPKDVPPAPADENFSYDYQLADRRELQEAEALLQRSRQQAAAMAEFQRANQGFFDFKEPVTPATRADTSKAISQRAITDSSSSSPSSASASSMPHGPVLDLKTLSANAARGNPLAQLTLGKHFLLKGDFETGCTWLMLSAQQENIDAHCWLCFFNLSSANITERQNAQYQHQRTARSHFTKAVTLCKSAAVVCKKISAIYQLDTSKTYETNSAYAWQKMADCHRMIAELPNIIKSAREDGQTILAKQEESLLTNAKETLAALELQFFGAAALSAAITAQAASSSAAVTTATAGESKAAKAVKTNKTKDKKKRQAERRKIKDQKAQEEKIQKEAAAKAAQEQQRQRAIKAAQDLFDGLQGAATQQALTADTAEAQHKLSQLYQKGNEAITSDEKQALTWLQTACRTAQAVAQQLITPYETAMQKVVLASIENNIRITVLDADNVNDIESALANAQLYLAIKYEYGIGGVTKNAVRAAELYQQAVKTFDSANTWYALRHHRAISTETKMALEWYAKAPQQKHPLALYDQAQLCHLDDKNPRSLERAFTLYQEVAKRSYEKECKQMAETYDEIPSLVSLAKTLCSIDDYEAAKKIGYIPAWHSLGKNLETSKPDQALAAQLIAARCGNPNAQHQLALWHEKGNARPYIARNKPTAFAWYLLAAEQGLPKAQCHLGNCYFNGDGVSADATRAVQWYTLAAPNNINAAYELGCRYERGAGVAAVDLKQAVGLYTSAAEHGHVEAMNKLVTYYRGTGANATHAERWLQCVQAATRKKADEKKEAELDGKDEKKTSLAKTTTDDKDEEKEESAQTEDLSGKEKEALAATICVTVDKSFNDLLNSDGLRRCKNTIIQHIAAFTINPLNNTLDTKKLKGFANVLRIRSGDYRIFIIKQVIGDIVIYHIDTIVPRGEAYKQQVLARIEKKAQELNKKS